MLKHRWMAALALAVGLGAAASGPAMAVPPPPPPSAVFGLYPATSSLGVVPTQNGKPTFYEYVYQVVAGNAVNDTISFDVCLDNSSGTSNGNWSDNVVVPGSGGIDGTFSGDVTVMPTSFSFNQNSTIGGCQTGTITIAIPGTDTQTIGGTNTGIHFKLNGAFPSTGSGKL